MNNKRFALSLIGKLVGLGAIIMVAYFAWDYLATDYTVPFFDKKPTESNKQSVVNSGQEEPDSKEISKDEKQGERHLGQVFHKTDEDCLISIPDKARTINGKKELTYILPLDNCKFLVNEYVEVEFGGKLDSDSPQTTYDDEGNIDGGDEKIDETIIPSNNEPIRPIDNTQSQIVVEPHNQDQLFEKLSLTTTREGNDVAITYHDTSGKTNSVTVVLRNSEKEIFSGTFISSKFETSVQDVSDETDHIIEMVIDHAIYGKVYSSVFNPAGENDNEINGVFKKQ